MGSETRIAWCTSTFNAWEGCEKVSPGCKNCYAETRNKRFSAGANWGPGAPRKLRSDAYWREPLAWNAWAKAAHDVLLLGAFRPKVFCSSLADVFDSEAPTGKDGLHQRERLWRLIAATPHLDWLLLTKRPENLQTMLPWLAKGEAPWPNVWLGTTVENQEAADLRIPLLLKVPAAVRFLSVEPQLGPVDLSKWLHKFNREPHCDWCEDCVGILPFGEWQKRTEASHGPLIDWVITGGESGAHARPYDVAWARSLVAQCRAAGVAPFVKQLGAMASDGPMTICPDCGPYVKIDEDGSCTTCGAGTMCGDADTKRHPERRIRTKDKAGADPAEWPEDLRIQEFPR